MQNRVIKNTSWIVGCRIVQALLNLVISMFSARYLGPSNYGLITYAASITAFMLPVMQLGLRSTLVQEFIEHPKKEGETLGTAITMNIVSSLLCIVGITAFTMIANSDEPETIIVCALYSINLIFQAFEMIQYWFQAKLLSKYTSITMLFSYIVVSAYKIYLLVAGKNVYWFAVSQAIDYALISVALFVIYKKLHGQKFSFSFKRSVEMLKKSRYYIVSSMMVTIFAQTDKIMLKFMGNNESVGQYAAAVTCAGVTSFVFTAIIDSFRPVILESKQKSQDKYDESVSVLSSVIIYLSLMQCVAMTVFSGLIVHILYGSDYAQSADILKVLVWYTTFSYMGPVRNIWILAEHKHKYLWVINLCGAVGNIILNLILIPLWGVMGAATASLITQFFTNFVIGFIISPIRGFNRLMLNGLNPKFAYMEVKKLCKRR